MKESLNAAKRNRKALLLSQKHRRSTIAKQKSAPPPLHPAKRGITAQGYQVTPLSSHCRPVSPPRLFVINPLNAKLNLICHLLALLGAHHIFPR